MIQWHLDFPSLYSGQCRDKSSFVNPDFSPLFSACKMSGMFSVKQRQNSPIQGLSIVAAKATCRNSRSGGCLSVMGEGGGTQPHCWVQTYLKSISIHELQAPRAPSNRELRLVARGKACSKTGGCKYPNTLPRLSLAHIGQSHIVFPDILHEEEQLEQRNPLTLKMLNISVAPSGPTECWIPEENHKPLSQMLYNLDTIRIPGDENIWSSQYLVLV